MRYEICVRKTKKSPLEHTGKVLDSRGKAAFYCAGYNTALRDIGHRARAVVVDERGRVVWPL